MPDEAIKTVAEAASRGDEWAIVLLAVVVTVGVLGWFIDKTYFHTKGKKNGAAGMAKAIEILASNQRELIETVKDVRSDVRDVKRDTVGILRAL